MSARKLSAVLICILLIFTTGCWDKIELDQRALALAIAIDAPEKGGGDSKDGNESSIKAVFYMPIPSKLLSGSVDTFSVEESVGKNLPAAIENLNMRFSRQVFLGDTKIILIGENALKDDKIIKGIMDFIEREPDIGREMQIAVVRGETKDLANLKPKFEKVFAVYMQGVFQNSGRIASSLALSINEFLSLMRETKGRAVIPVVEVEGDKVAIKELALLKDYKLLSYVDPKYVKPYSIITHSLRDGQIDVPYKKQLASLKVTSAYEKLWLESYGDRLSYKMNVRIEGDINNYEFADDIFGDDTINDIKERIEKYVKGELNSVTDYFQNEVGYDYLNLGDYTKKHHYDIFEKYKDNWDQEFKKAKIDYDVQVLIRRIGGTKG